MVYVRDESIVNISFICYDLMIRYFRREFFAMSCGYI